ncbi:MAG: hypothetical protein U0P45_17275 [Acidimicrobiales bacterium]
MTSPTRSLLRCTALAATLLLAACSSGSGGGAPTTGSTTPATTAPKPIDTTPPSKPLADQAAPSAINGLVVQGSTLWIASIKDDVVLQVDRTTGEILRRVDTEGAGPDDVAVAPDGSVWTTGFGNGDLGRIAGDRYQVEAHMQAGINPIEFGPKGQLYVGTYGPGGTLYRVKVGQGGEQTTPVIVATDLDDINAFGVTPDGLIVAPTGGVAGPGGAIGIDVPSAGEGVVTTLASGLDATAAGATDAKGVPYVLGNLSGKVYRVDPEAKTAKVWKTVPTGAPFDNMAFAPDGTLYLSSFTAPKVTVVAPDGSVSQIDIGTPAT